MRVNKTIDEKSIVVEIFGRIDTVTAEDLRAELADLPRDRKLILDFANTEYITSAGLRVLLIARKNYPDEMLEINNVSETINDIFTMTGFDQLLPVNVVSHDPSKYITLSLKSFLKKKVEKYGSAPIAVVSDGNYAGRQSYTWNDIEVCSQIIADDLRKQGVARGTHVGLMGTNTMNWIYTFFALQKLGAIVFLINFNLNAEETITIAEVGDITHLCYGDLTAVSDTVAFTEEVSAEGTFIHHTYNFHSGIDFLARKAEYDALVGKFEEYVDGDDAAIVIFTSGTTGKAKAVMLSSYNLLNAAQLTAKHFKVTSEDIYCQILPMFHLFGLAFGLLGSMLTDTLVVIPSNLKTATIIRVIESEKCSLLYSVPTLLLAISLSKAFTPEKADSIRCIMMGGAGVAVPQMIALQEKFRNAVFCSIYGMSEMAPVSLTPYGDSAEHVAKTIGKVVKNIEIKIVKLETGEECKPGESGEILVRGFSSMVGYYKLDPSVQPYDEDGWLHTGDLAVMEEDGYITLVGRAKEMIKKGGENIAPGEIAELVACYPGVADVKVIGVKDDFYTEVVGVAVAMRDGIRINQEELIAYLTPKLARYKLPSYVFQFDAFPTLANGKVDAVGIKKYMNEKAVQMNQSSAKR